jgi:hypothetical protein
MKIPFLSEGDSPQRRTIILVLLISLGIHAGAAFVAGVWIVARYFIPPPATFVAKKSVTIPPKLVEQRMQSAEFDAAAPKPSFDDKMASLRPTDFALPDLPKMPVEDMMPIDPSTVVNASADSLVGSGGNGSGSGNGNGGGGFGTGASAVSFFGIKDTARRVVIVVDTSNSMFERSRNGQLHTFDFKAIKDETVRLIGGLGVNTQFNVVIYEGGSMAWKEEFLPASDPNKQEATAWVRELDEDPESSIGRRKGKGPKLMEGGGTRLDTAMKQTFAMQPDVIFIITDGEINRGDEKIEAKEMLDIIEELQRGLPEKARIHVVHYVTAVVRKEEQDLLKSIARRNGGRFTEIKADEAQ